jgi:hypothetical protein
MLTIYLEARKAAVYDSASARFTEEAERMARLANEARQRAHSLSKFSLISIHVLVSLISTHSVDRNSRTPPFDPLRRTGSNQAIPTRPPAGVPVRFTQTQALSTATPPPSPSPARSSAVPTDRPTPGALSVVPKNVGSMSQEQRDDLVFPGEAPGTLSIEEIAALDATFNDFKGPVTSTDSATTWYFVPRGKRPGVYQGWWVMQQ